MTNMALPIKALWTVLAFACVTFLFTAATRAEGEAANNDSLAGTTWSGRDSDGDDYVFTFDSDGTLSYKSPSGSFRNGKWKQFRGAVYLNINNGYSEYLGEINNNLIEGKAWNVKGHKWTWKVSKDK